MEGLTLTGTLTFASDTWITTGAGRRSVWIDRDGYPLGLRLSQSAATGDGAALSAVELLTRWNVGGEVSEAGLPVPSDWEAVRVTHHGPSLSVQEVAQTILDVAATGVRLGPPLLSAIGTALAASPWGLGTLAQRLFIPDNLRTDDDLPDGRKVWAGYTEPYPGAWPRKAVTLAHAGDLAALWPYLGDPR